MCRKYLTKIYSTISRASSCRCVGKTGCLRYDRGSFTPVFRKYFGYLVKLGGNGGISYVSTVGKSACESAWAGVSLSWRQIIRSFEGGTFLKEDLLRLQILQSWHLMALDMACFFQSQDSVCFLHHHNPYMDHYVVTSST